MKRYGVLLLVLLLLHGVLAAELSGTIYDENLQKANNVLVTVDTTPQQRMLSTDGTYAFTLPPGNYTVVAQYQYDKNNRTSTEYILITQDGTFIFDLFLLPGLDALVFEEETVFPDEDLLAPDTNNSASQAATRFLIILVLFFFGYFVWNKLPQKSGVDADDLATQVLIYIDAEGGRVTQKDLRKQFPQSEAKMSLVVSELENAGKLQKIKKGRGNILIRKK